MIKNITVLILPLLNTYVTHLSGSEAVLASIMIFFATTLINMLPESKIKHKYLFQVFVNMAIYILTGLLSHKM